MLGSVKRWLNMDLTIHPCISTDGYGDRQFGVDSVVQCYATSKPISLRTARGEEVIANMTFYVDGAVHITEHDDITFEDVRSPIVIIAPYYRDGKADIKVVYTYGSGRKSNA